jgi:hypothetical protein
MKSPLKAKVKKAAKAVRTSMPAAKGKKALFGKMQKAISKKMKG